MPEWWPSLDLSHASWDADDWVYLTEGAANLLCRYVGVEQEPFVRRYNGDVEALVLRIVKHNPGKAFAILDPQEMVESVFAHLIPRSYLPELKRVSICKSDGTLDSNAQQQFLKRVAQRCEADRPTKRRVTGCIRLDAPHFWVMPDLSRSMTPDTPVFEIKPKCGFIHSGPTRYPVKQQTSRYRMHRILKLAEREQAGADHLCVPNVSMDEWQSWYDPLDLFSGQEDRVRAALEALCNEWIRGSTDNLHVFHGGRRLQAGSPADLTLLNTLSGTHRSVPEYLLQCLSDAITTREAQDLLASLVEAQAKLDPLGIEGLADAWHTLFGTRLEYAWDSQLSPTESTMLRHPSFAEYAELVHCLDRLPQRVSGPIDLRTLFLAYTLSATLKDVSIMLGCAHGKWRLHLVDLDPKHPRNLAKAVRQDAAIVELFDSWLQGVQQI